LKPSVVELRTIVVAVTGGNRAETCLCTRSNRFVPVRVFNQTPPHLSQEIFNTLGGLPDSRGALSTAVTIADSGLCTQAPKNGLFGKSKKNSFLTNIRNKNEKSDSLVLVSF
jgi:hypothetical protein